MVADFDGLMQDRSYSIANALHILQSWTKQSIYSAYFSTLLAYQHEYTATDRLSTNIVTCRLKIIPFL